MCFRMFNVRVESLKREKGKRHRQESVETYRQSHEEVRWASTNTEQSKHEGWQKERERKQRERKKRSKNEIMKQRKKEKVKENKER